MAKSKINRPQPPVPVPPLTRVVAFVRAHRIQLVVFFSALFVLFLRRPDALLNAQFWAEDAKWFSEAVNSHYSLANFFAPYAGYLTLIQRIIAWISGAFPLEYSPLVFNLCAMGVQALVLVYLWSKRTDFITTKMKIFLSVIFVLLPYTEEIHANVTNAQWFMGLLLFLILFMREASTTAMRVVDRSIVVVASLSGPFAIFLTPILAFDAWRSKKIPFNYYLVAGGAAVQFLCLLLTREPYGETHIGYSVTKFFQIVGGQVFGSGLFGYQALEFFLSKPWIAPVTAVLGLQLMLFVFVKSNMIMRYFILFASFIFGAALVSTLGTPPGMTWWYYFTTEAFGGRYYLFLHLAVYVALGWVVLTKVKVHLLLRMAAAFVLLLSLWIGVPHDFRHRPYKDFHYKSYIKKYHQLKPGESIAVPVNPGEFWHAGLTKQ